jgi:AraC family transcriptional regulator
MLRRAIPSAGFLWAAPERRSAAKPTRGGSVPAAEVLSRVRTDTGQSDGFSVLVDISSAELWNGIRLQVGDSAPDEMAEGVSSSHLVWVSQCESSSLEVAFDGVWRSVPMRPNLVAVTPAGMGLAARWKTPMRGIHIEVPTEAFRELLPEEAPERYSDMRPESGIPDPSLSETAVTLMQELRAGNPRGKLYADTLAAAFASHLVSSYTLLPLAAARRARRLSPPRLRRVLDFIFCNLESEISLTELAKVSGLSPFHFSHAFRSNTGVSPYRFVLRARIERAAALLKGSRLTLAEIALSCGFYSASHFAGTFRRMIGATPGQSRRFS